MAATIPTGFTDNPIVPEYILEPASDLERAITVAELLPMIKEDISEIFKE